jgi:serine protease
MKKMMNKANTKKIVHSMLRVSFSIAFALALGACGSSDIAATKESVAASKQSNAIASADEPMIQMQDAAGANITGFSYDAKAVADGVTTNLKKTTALISSASQEGARSAALGIIIKYKSDSPSYSMSAAASEGLNKPSATSMASAQAVAAKVGVDLFYSMRTALGTHTYKSTKLLAHDDAIALAQAIKNTDPSIEYAEPNFRYQTQFVPNDPSFIYQWGYELSPRNGGVRFGINMPLAWNLTNGSGAKVAVIDTGYTNHPDLLPNILPGYDFISDVWTANDGGGRDSDASDPGTGIVASNDPYGCGAEDSNWHGTHVAGTVAASTNNGTGVAGVAYGAKVVPVRVLGRCGGYDNDITDGIIWAAGGNVAGVPANANPVHVINMSLSGNHACGAGTQAAIDFAIKMGVTVVVAAGNAASDAASYSPANCNNVIVVAATDLTGNRASFSNYGAAVDVAAPGVSILSTLNYGTQAPSTHGYAYYSGTSMAAPHVAGVAALLKVQNPSRTHYDIEYLIKRSVYSLGTKCLSCGTGLLDAYAALTQSTTASPVFRLNNKSLAGAYLFTAYGSERDAAFANYNFGIEGVAFHVQLSPAAGLSPVVRFRDKTTGAYLFSIYETEIASLRTTYAYKFVEEGTSWYASKAPLAGWSPLYRFRNKLNGTYTFTAYESERVAMNTTYAATFVEEGVAYYIIP